MEGIERFPGGDRERNREIRKRNRQRRKMIEQREKNGIESSAAMQRQCGQTRTAVWK